MRGRHLLFIVVLLCLFMQYTIPLQARVGSPRPVRSAEGLNNSKDDHFQAASSWLSGWDFRKAHTIIGSSGAGTNYQVIVKVYNTAGTDSGDTVYVGSKCKTDFSDIRFTASDGITLLSYWLASVSGSLATFWVKVIDDLGSNQVIYIYYGNSGASSLSNGFTTFMFFDDFDDGVVDTSRWNTETTLLPGAGNQSYDETDGKLHIYSYSTSGWQGYLFYSKTNFTTTNFAIHIESNWTNLDYVRGAGGFNQGGYRPSDNKPTEFALSLYGDYSVYGYHYLEWVDNWNANLADLSSGTAQMDLSLSGTSYNDVLSGTYSTTKTGTNSDFNGTFQVLLANTVQYWTGVVSCDTYWDVVYMRKYVASEPQHGAWGTEQISPFSPGRVSWHHDCSNTTGWIMDPVASESTQFDLGAFEFQDNVTIMSNGSCIYSNPIPYHTGYFHGATFIYELPTSVLTGQGLDFQAQINHTGSLSSMGGVTVALYDQNKNLAYFMGTQDMWYSAHVVTILGYKDQDGRRVTITDQDGPLVVDLRAWHDETNDSIYAYDNVATHLLAAKGAYEPERWIRYVALTFYNGEDNQYESEKVTDIRVSGRAATLAISHPEDIAYEAGTTGHKIAWTHSVPLPASYEMLQNGLLVHSGIWDGSHISISADGLDPGLYNFTNVIHYNVTGTASDTVMVTVYDTTPPTMNSPADVYMNETDTGRSIVWVPSDLYPLDYEVRCNGSVIASGAWNSTGEDIVVSLDGLAPGVYVYSVSVTDMSYNTAGDVVTVKVGRVSGSWDAFWSMNPITIVITIGSLTVMVVVSAMLCRSRR